MPEGTFHLDKALTDVSIAYRNAAFVAERVFPSVLVDNKTDKFYTYGKENFRARNDRRSPGAEALPSRWTLSSDSYFCDGHALKDYVPRENQANQDPALDLLIDTTEMLTEQMQLNREDALVTQLIADLTGASVVDLAAIKWDVDANDPIAKLRAERLAIAKRIGQFPNVALFAAPVFNAVIQNAKVTGRITGAPSITPSLVSPQEIATLLEVDEVIVAPAVKDTANEGQATSLDFVWGKRALLFYRTQNPGRKSLSLGYTFRWSKALQALGVAGGGAQGVERYYWQPTKSDVVEVHDYYDLKTITKDAGTLFINAIA